MLSSGGHTPLCREHCRQAAGSRALDPKEQDRRPQGATQQGQKTADLETARRAPVLPAGADAVTAKQKSAFKLQSRAPTPFLIYAQQLRSPTYYLKTMTPLFQAHHCDLEPGRAE